MTTSPVLSPRDPLSTAAAFAAIALLSPLLLLRAALAWRSSGRVLRRLARVDLQGRVFDRLEFDGDAPLRGLAVLGNLALGTMAWTGPRARRPDEEFAPVDPDGTALPGLVSRHALRKRMGIAFDAEPLDDADFLRRATRASRLALLSRAALLGALGGGRRLVPAPAEFEMAGVRIAHTDLGEAVSWIVGRARDGLPTDVAFVNPHCLNVARRNAAYASTLREADRVFPDGVGLRLAARMRGFDLRANVNGTDMLPRLAVEAAEAGLSFFLLGAAPGVAEATAEAMRAMHPSVRIAGVRDGFFEKHDDEAVVDAINASGAGLLLVAMGVPLQEQWLARHRERLAVPVRIGVGGLFDFYSGRIPRAPQWMRELGAEWCWRLAQEPRRMWKRYLVGNVAFLANAWAEARAARRPEDVLDAWEISSAARARRIALVHAAVAARRLARAGGVAAKRALDVVAAGAALLLLSPLFLLTALAIRTDSPGPVLFRQVRVGRGGREFRMFKFRSMHVDAEARRAALAQGNEMNGGVIFKMRDDPRITRVGRVIRRLSIDELPQLWNVLAGDMTLVGPRPPLPSEVALYSPAERRRLDGEQGITCIWQVSGRSEIPFPEQVRLDVQYIEGQSLWTDLRLLLKTVPAVLGARGAY